MTGKAGFKAGLIGAAAVLALTLLSLVPRVGSCCGCLNILVYVGIGVLAGFYLSPPRTAGAGAGAGALAGLISGAVGGLASGIIALIRGSVMAPRDILSSIPPEQMRQLRDLGFDPGQFAQMFGQGGGAAFGALGASMCCLGSLAVGAALGAIGGAVYAAAKKE